MMTSPERAKHSPIGCVALSGLDQLSTLLFCDCPFGARTLDVLKSMSQSLVKNLVHLVFWSQITALKSVAFGWLEGRRSWMGRCG
jgi:hypothetical protein